MPSGRVKIPEAALVSTAGAALASVVAAMESELRVAVVPDYPGALNGLQLASRSGRVTRVGVAVEMVALVVQV